MSKLQFRARALDASKPMPIYMAEELPDLTDYSAINRAVPQMPSGMEKEEECEHHLQRAICTGLIIPTPEVASMADVEAYDKIYPANYKQPRQLIHMQPFTMEQEIPDYDMDSEDEAWVEEQARRLDVTPLKFESMMDRLEKSSGQTVVTLHDAKALLKEDDDLIIAIFDYWLNKRLKTQHPLILAVKTEHRLGSAANNPYLAFRRRTEKMQTRKNRKNDETSYEKMLKLRRDLSRAVTLLEMVKRREKTKREHLHLTIEIVEKRYQAQDFSGQLLAEVSALRTSRPAFAPLFTNQFTNQNWANKATIKDEIVPRKEKRQYKKRKHKPTTSHTSRNLLNSSGLEPIISSDEDDVTSNAMLASPEESETADPDEGRYTFRRNKHCSYHMPITNKLGNWPWCSREENGTADHRYRFALTSIKHPKPRCIGFARRRLGRGGRVILDRISTPYDDLWREMDYTIIETPSLRERLAFEKCQQKLKARVEETSSLNSVDDTEMQYSVVGPPVKSSYSLDTNKTISSVVNNSSGVTPALRNLYSEHNYNSTTPTVVGGYPPDGYPSSTTSIVKTELTDSNDIKNTSVKEESQCWTTNWTSDVSNVVKRESYDDISPQLISERLSEVTTSVAHVNSSFSDTNQLDKGVNSHEEDTNYMLEVLSEIKRDWLHFRPKTPPADYEIPCNLLPAKEDIFNPNEFTPITIEIENLSSTPPSALCDTSNFTSEFTLNDIYTDLSLDYQLQQQEQQQIQQQQGLEQDNAEDLGLILNDIRQIVTSSSSSTDISDNNSSCLCSTNYLTEHQDSMTNFGCSRVSVRSNSDRECERTTNSDVLTTRSSGDVTNCGNGCPVTTAGNNSVPVTSISRRNLQLLQQNTSQQQRTTTHQQQVLRTQSILSSTLTSPNKYNNNSNLNSSTGSSVSVTSTNQIPTLVFDRVTGNVSSPSSVSVGVGAGVRMIGTLTTAGLVRASPTSEHHLHTNGPVNTHLESSMIRRVNYKPSAADESLGDHSRIHRLQNNTSMNSQVRRALLSSQTINTLNSNSANVMDSSSISSSLPNESTLINSDNSSSVKMKSTLHHLKTGGDNNIITTVTQQTGASTVTTSGGQSGGGTTNNSSKPQIVRKNNTLAMEVT